jgi:hypothetical protein
VVTSPTKPHLLQVPLPPHGTTGWGPTFWHMSPGGH